ncbi:MAG: hypothetical protein HXX20_08925 [Chloroflexi bacterium]|nr:hypothetical protein [Chloroflexota bacterium]
MELTTSLKETFMAAAKQLKGSARRVFMARIVKELGQGGQVKAEKELGWNRRTIRKGTKELESGVPIEDNFSARGRKLVEEELPNLLTDMKAILDSQSQTDPQFKSNGLYTRLSAAEVRRQLIAQKGYSDEELPTPTTIRYKLNQMGYPSSRVQKSKPKKNSTNR